MSRLKNLLTNLCTEGVNFYPLGKIAEIGNIGVDKKIIEGQNKVMLLNYMDVYRHPYLQSDMLSMEVTASDDKIKKCDIRRGDIFITPTSETIEDIGHSAVAIEDISNAVYSYHVMRLRLINQKEISPYFINYLFRANFLQNQILKNATGLTRFGLTRDKWYKLLLPIPPLPVQKEIVRILDNYSAAEQELEAQLDAELEAREKQYAYYRDALLDFSPDKPRIGSKHSRLNKLIETLCPDGVVYQELNEVINYEQPNKFIVQSTNYDDRFSIPVLTAGQTFILGYTSEDEGIYLASSEKPVIIFDDFTTSFHWVDFDFKVKSSALKILTVKNPLVTDFRYLFYAIKCVDYEPTSHSRQWIDKYSKIKIPIPPILVQKEIVRILDQFDTLVNDIKQGLPAEISARRKQYEYYREKLLTFKEKQP